MPQVYIHLVSSFAALGGFLLGYDTGAISGTIITPAFLKRFQPVTSLIQGAIVSSLVAGCFVGSLFSGWISDFLGRKSSIVIASALVFVGSLVQASSFSLPVLFAGRFLAGLGTGQLSQVVPLYQAEIAPPDIRGRLVSFYQLAVSVGLTISFWISYAFQEASGELSFRIPLALQAVPALILGLGCFFLPASPRWLIEKGEIEESHKVLALIWESKTLASSELIAEFNAIKDSVETQKAHGFSLLFKASNFRRLTLGVLLLLYQQLTGIGSVTYFAPLLFRQLGIQTVHASLIAQGITGLVSVFFSSLSLTFADVWGRKKILISGAILMTISMAAVGGILGGVDVSKNDYVLYVAIGFIYLFVASFSYSWGPVGWIYPAEIFSQKLRSRALAICISSSWLFNFAATLLTPLLLRDIGWKLYILFAVFGVIMSISVMLSFPETKNRGLDEMELIFSDQPMTRTSYFSRPSFDSDLNA
ncbi:hypothetical protein DSO57_1036779 [Entomophthora muscae]|uniref:Uncharacterized protein n=1 Tax=Entomophthora muscae TaxID=34485 RepID=A0ACC2TA60_9FUNG|nr:hypothetical protein DSO57_1036779 [Entomophthora muscae]